MATTNRTNRNEILMYALTMGVFVLICLLNLSQIDMYTYFILILYNAYIWIDSPYPILVKTSCSPTLTDLYLRLVLGL